LPPTIILNLYSTILSIPLGILLGIIAAIYKNKWIDHFISIIVKTEGRRYGGFAKTHEGCLVYARNVDNIAINEITVKGKYFRFKDERGGFNIQDLRNQNARAFNSLNRPNLRYPFYVDLTNINYVLRILNVFK